MLFDVPTTVVDGFLEMSLSLTYGDFGRSDSVYRIAFSVVPHTIYRHDRRPKL